jgi:hypothetical protein
VNRLNFLVICGNFKPTEDEFSNLVSSAGLKVTNIRETKSPVSASEAKVT